MRTYLTVVTTDDYAIGALALRQSLLNTTPRPRYGFVVVLTKTVSDECERAIRDAGIQTLRLNKHLRATSHFPTQSGKQGFLHWNNTLSKLLIFDLIQYEKIVYLDSDMIVLRNLDDLFERPHMSAVVADKLMPGHESWVQLCSGTIVIEPKAGLTAAILEHAKDVESRGLVYSDQDVLQECFADWPMHPELHLEQTYGVFVRSLDRYLKVYGYNLNLAAPDDRTIAIVHFVGARKPWTWSIAGRSFRLLMHLCRGESAAANILLNYFGLLRWARAALRSSNTRA